MRFDEVEAGPSGLTEMSKEKICHVETIPIEVLARIFSHFNLPTRASASMVCRRWRTLLLSPRCPMEDVVVLNIFERAVWDQHVKNNKGVRVKTLKMDEIEVLKNLSSLISEANTVKFWYKDKEFASNCIAAIADSKMDLKTVDLYPYGAELVADVVNEKMPSLSGITMRPHEKTFFWTGLDMNHFPAFQNLKTLCVDTINFGENVHLPKSLTALEFQNRNSVKHLDFLKILAPLTNLESLSMSHSDFSKKADYAAFLDSINGDVLPKLAFLTMKFCKFPTEKFTDFTHFEQYNDGGPEKLAKDRWMFLKMVKFDLCYGQMDHIGRTFLEINKKIAVFVLQIMNDEPALVEAGQLAKYILHRGAWLHLAVMQRDGMRKQQTLNVPKPNPFTFPVELFKVLTRFECSFVDTHNVAILDHIFAGTNPIAACQDVKLINCPGITNEHLTKLAERSKMLRRLSVISCDQVDEEGILPFFSNINFDSRKSLKLEIVWKRRVNCAKPANLYLEIAHKYREYMIGKRLLFTAKVFTEDSEGERIILSDRKSRKKLYLQNYSEPDEYRIVGLVVGNSLDEPPEEPPPPVPEDIEEQKTRLAKLLKKSSV